MTQWCIMSAPEHRVSVNIFQEFPVAASSCIDSSFTHVGCTELDKNPFYLLHRAFHAGLLSL